MPLFMDLHIVPGAVIDDVVEAHKLDVAIQDQFGCDCMTFWFDKDRGHAFCLIDAPDKESVVEMHDEAHGLIPHKIMQVNSKLVAAFLGRLQDPESLDELSKSDVKAFYSDPAFRILMVTNQLDFKLLAHTSGKDKAYELFSLQNEIIHQQIDEYEGQKIEMEGKGFVISFITPSQAIQCALAIQKRLHIAAELLRFRIGLHAGVPVANSEELFGESIRYARHLCLLGQGRQITLSNQVHNLHKEDKKKLISDKNIRVVSSEEENFLGGLISSLSENWNRPDFDVSDLSKELYVSTSQLYRKTTSATGFAPNVLLREYRLNKSLDLLKKADGNISQTAYDAGFNSPSYFTKCFQKKFGLKPLEYLKLEG